jgi:hypothetical protein
MSDPSAMMLLTYALDEDREARDLVRLSHAGLARRPQGWRDRFGAAVATRDGFVAGLTVQYLTENLRRARTHWSECVAYVLQLTRSGQDEDLVLPMAASLQRAGLDSIVDDLAVSAVPTERKAAAAYLDAVLSRMSECDRILAATRSRLLLERVRDEQR